MGRGFLARCMSKLTGAGLAGLGKATHCGEVFRAVKRQVQRMAVAAQGADGLAFLRGNNFNQAGINCNHKGYKKSDCHEDPAFQWFCR